MWQSTTYWGSLARRAVIPIHLTKGKFKMKRHKMSKRANRANFRRGARHIHPKNMMGAPMRGGIRL